MTNESVSLYLLVNNKDSENPLTTNQTRCTPGEIRESKGLNDFNVETQYAPCLAV